MSFLYCNIQKIHPTFHVPRCKSPCWGRSKAKNQYKILVMICRGNESNDYPGNRSPWVPVSVLISHMSRNLYSPFCIHQSFKKSVLYLPLYCILVLSKLKHPVDANQNKPQLIGSSLQKAWSKILVFSRKTSVSVSWQSYVWSASLSGRDNYF